ncbi:MAG: hypothetical protein J5J00_02900 [Deltaproteobacteria bacterium]|nr:hypothetical protein [Deltaproteobacteria bacterium]
MSGITLGLNISSLRALAELGRSSRSFAEASERLSSGLRINKASDDGAGLAISSLLAVNERLSTQAIRNTNDAISMLNIASSTLDQQVIIIERMKELAVQAANGVYSDTQREALNTEYTSLMEEYNRIAEATSFNGQKLLDTNDEQILIQSGIDSSLASTITVALADTATLMGEIQAQADRNASGTVSAADTVLTGRGPNFPSTATLDELNEFFQGVLLKSTIVDSNGQERTVYTGISVSAGLIVILPTLVNLESFTDLGNGGLESMLQSSPGLDLASSSATTSYSLTFSDTGATAEISFDLTGLSYRLTDSLGAYYPELRGDNRPTALAFTGIDSAGRAASALTTLSNKLDDLSAVRGEIGAAMSRMNVAIGVMAVQGEQYAAARDRIVSADIAEEAAKSIRAGILLQTAASIITNSQAQHSIVLGLLR